MSALEYNFTKLKAKIYCNKIKQKEYINNWFRLKGIMIGDNCSIFSNIVSSEPYLITIGNNVTISNDVQFITHDNSIIKVSRNEYTDIFGEIVIGDNCFIGAHSIILPGVTISDNVVVAAGSVVTKSTKSKNIIIAGNPARIISNWTDYLNRNTIHALNTFGMNYHDKEKYLLANKSKFKKT